MVAGALAPVVVLAVAAAALLVQHERDTMEQEAIGRTRSAMSAIDVTIQGHLETVQALSASRALEAGDLRAFHDETRRVLRAQPTWLNVGLASADGRQLFDAVLPFGGEGPVSGDLESFQDAVRTGKPVVGNVDSTAAVPQPAVRIRVPVQAGGVPRYVITVVVRPDSFNEVLRAQQIPDGWVIALVDGDRRFVARIPPMPAGTLVSESFRAAIERSPNGWFAGSTLEGARTYTPYVTSAMTGWVLGIAIPARAVDAAANRTFVAMAVGIAAAVGLALFLGWSMARRIAAPIASLAAGTFPEQTKIDEITALSAALREKLELAQREKQALQASDRAKDEFLAMLSHELRNPLAALAAAAHVVKIARPDSEAALKARAVVERQTRHMARLVGDLLDVSRVTMGKVALERERLDLNDSVRRLLQMWRASGRLERHQLLVDAQPVWVHADRARIEQILSNLLDNAIKFTPAGRRITVSLRQEDDAAVLRVADEGEGLAPGSAERMFGLFVQGERGLDRAAGGLGVGLALVKRLTELHGGSVSAASAGVGRGATFTVRLPAVLPPAPAAAPRPVERSPAPPRRVLIVEDNDDTRQMLHEALAFSGHDVREARDGASALAAAAEARPDVALIDIGLPDVDGYEVARRLRAAPGGRRMGLIALTGYGQAEDQRRAFDAGFDAHLTKPVAPERLKQVMAGLA
jgi:signal transduction histidine kinase